MADEEFLIVSLPEMLDEGATVRVHTVVETLQAARKAVESLPAGVVGRVAVVQRRALYDRQPTIESREIESPIIAKRGPSA